MLCRAVAIVSLAALISGCSLVTRQSHDYIFGVTLLAVDERDRPVPYATVSLHVGGEVYEATKPVQSVDKVTNESGGCVFTYTAHQRGVAYSVSVAKQGFMPEVLSGVASPQVHLKVRLRSDGVQAPQGVATP